MGKISNRIFVLETKTDKTTFDEWIVEHDAEIRADEQKRIMEILDNADDNAQALYLLGQYLITQQLKENV